MNSDGSNQRRLTNVDYKISGILRFSPKGDKILYSIYRDGFSREICTMNADGSNQNILTVGFNPRYTPDGNKIVFESLRAVDEGWLEIFIMNSDGSNLLNLTNNPATDLYPIIQP
jgi:TolB protein